MKKLFNIVSKIGGVIFCLSVMILCSCGKEETETLSVFNIVPPFENATNELAEDIVKIQKERVAHESLLIFTLVPEGKPAIDKIEVLGKRFKEIQKKINGRARLGVLVQSSLGHAYPLKNPNDMEHIVRIDTLREEPNKCCPLGENTVKYMTDICRKIAMLKPTHIMIDDDFRMYIIKITQQSKNNVVAIFLSKPKKFSGVKFSEIHLCINKVSAFFCS